MTGTDVESVNTGTVWTETSARRLTEDIKLATKNIGVMVEKLVEKIDRARSAEVYLLLGYKSWPEYVAAEFEPLQNLRRDDRQHLVAELAGLGMSTRAIAPVVGISKSSVDRELSQVGTVDRPASVTSLDGRLRPSTQPVPLTPRSQRRRPLPDAYKDAVWEMKKAAERLGRLTADDRFARNRSELASGGAEYHLLLIIHRLCKAAERLHSEPYDTSISAGVNAVVLAHYKTDLDAAEALGADIGGAPSLG